ncbi:DMT family transporter [Streptosporangium lutulentum]|uniref:Drug/metabolite transporter (DMT)-like permease n=1 Tax=Streptosporangium lutulentum TaxID=1461250 RepID=A0ABT9QSP4_9ACTN|nr:DMT family transporter [Streptosporangium lutulentum]MDP9849764.1 drug/metabolite transporter (DMT)-like permease [Streptosporangium lutulentum]
MIAVLLAVLTAACNALSSVLQKRATRAVPESDAFRLALIWDLIRNPLWLGGLGALIGGFVFQAAALNFGGLALVQPILVIELPFTMILLSCMLRVMLDRKTWLAVGILTAGLTVLLASANPTVGDRIPSPVEWMIAMIVTVGIIGYLVMLAKLRHGESRAVLLGVASGLGFAFTAALITENTRVFAEDPPSLLTTWPLYSMIAAGLVSLFLLQNALQSGSLVTVQPALNVTDPVSSIGYGVALFGEDIRLGPWVMLELLGLGLILYGSVRLARSFVHRHGETGAPEK